MDAGLNVFEPNRSNLEPWKDGIKACNKLMKKNVKERLNMANEIWQRYEDNLEEVSKRKVNKPERVFGLQVQCRELDIFKILMIF